MEITNHEGLPKWSLIATKLPGRTGNMVKNYWRSRLRKNRDAEQSFAFCLAENQVALRRYIDGKALGAVASKF